jgi:hypothetical protein
MKTIDLKSSKAIKDRINIAKDALDAVKSHRFIAASQVWLSNPRGKRVGRSLKRTFLIIFPKSNLL